MAKRGRKKIEEIKTYVENVAVKTPVYIVETQFARDYRTRFPGQSIVFEAINDEFGVDLADADLPSLRERVKEAFKNHRRLEWKPGLMIEFEYYPRHDGDLEPSHPTWQVVNVETTSMRDGSRRWRYRNGRSEAQVLELGRGGDLRTEVTAVLPDTLATKRALQKLAGQLDRLNRQLADLFMPEQVEQTAQRLLEEKLRVELVATSDRRDRKSGAPVRAAR